MPFDTAVGPFHGKLEKSVMLVTLKGWFLVLLSLISAAAIYYRAFEQFPLPSSEDGRVRTELAEQWSQKVALEVKLTKTKIR